MCQQVYKGDVMKGLKDRAVTYEPGKEPWRRFAGPPSQVSTKRDAEGSLTVTNTARAGSTSGAAAAAAASAQAVTAVQGKKADKAAAAEAARIVNALLQGKVFFVADQPFADPGAELANAIKITKDEFWKEYRLVRRGVIGCLATDRVASPHLQYAVYSSSCRHREDCATQGPCGNQHTRMVFVVSKSVGCLLTDLASAVHWQLVQ